MSDYYERSRLYWRRRAARQCVSEAEFDRTHADDIEFMEDQATFAARYWVNASAPRDWILHRALYYTWKVLVRQNGEPYPIEDPHPNWTAVWDDWRRRRPMRHYPPCDGHERPQGPSPSPSPPPSPPPRLHPHPPASLWHNTVVTSPVQPQSPALIASEATYTAARVAALPANLEATTSLRALQPQANSFPEPDTLDRLRVSPVALLANTPVTPFDIPQRQITINGNGALVDPRQAPPRNPAVSTWQPQQPADPHEPRLWPTIMEGRRYNGRRNRWNG